MMTLLMRLGAAPDLRWRNPHALHALWRSAGRTCLLIATHTEGRAIRTGQVVVVVDDVVRWRSHEIVVQHNSRRGADRDVMHSGSCWRAAVVAYDHVSGQEEWAIGRIHASRGHSAEEGIPINVNLERLAILIEVQRLSGRARDPHAVEQDLAARGLGVHAA